MVNQGKVRGFAAYSPQTMEQLKQDLGLSMPIDKLLYCASYYRNAQKRDPFIEELRMLDRATAGTSHTPESLCVTDFLTNDRQMADTYADLIRKRGILRPNAKTPPTVAELSEVATRYLSRVGKSVEIPSCLPLLESKANGSFSALYLLPHRQTALEKGDLLILLSPSLSADQRSKNTVISAFLRQKSVSERIKQCVKISEDGLLRTLLSISSGLWIDPSFLSAVGDPVPLSMLASYAGAHLVCVSQKDYDRFSQIAKDCGVRASAFASILDGTEYVFADKGTRLLSFAADFLLSLFPLYPVRGELKDEESDRETKISHRIAKAEASGSLVAAASAAPCKNIFRNTLDTLLASILSQAICGHGHSAGSLILRAELPNDRSPEAIGEVLAMLLAIHRVETELALPAAHTEFVSVGGIAHPTLHAFVRSPITEPCPSVFSDSGNHLYCITPDLDKDGMIDFTSLRDLLTYAATLRKQGILASARVVCHEALTDVIREMRTETLSCRLTGTTVVFDGALPLALLLETKQPIPAKRIGRVCERIAPASSGLKTT